MCVRVQSTWSVPFLQKHFQVGAAGLGLVDSAQGIGMLAGGLSLGYLAARFKKIHLAALCLMVIGLLFIGMGWAPVFVIIIMLAGGLGVVNVPALSVVTTILQMVVPDDKRGRVSSAINGLGMATALISMSVAAVYGERIGLRNVYLLCGLINIAAAGMTLIIGQEPETALVVEATSAD